MYITVSPAYGRDYKSAADALADWEAGKDFVNETRNFTGGGTYISIREMPSGARITIRYKKLAETVQVR